MSCSQPDLPEIPAGNLEPEVSKFLNDRLSQLRDQPHSARAWGEMGRAFHAHGFLIKAGDCYTLAIEKAPGEFVWAYYMGLLLKDTDPDGALEWFEKAGILRGEFPPIDLRTGKILLNLGRLDEAREKFLKALERGTPAYYPRVFLARIEKAAGRQDSALTHVSAALKVFPDGTEALALKSDLMRDAQVSSDLEFHLKETHSGKTRLVFSDSLFHLLDSENRSLTRRKARADELFTAGHFEQAVDVMKQLLAEEPAEKIFVSLSTAQQRLDRVAQSLATLETGLAKFPDSPQLLNNMGMHFCVSGLIPRGMEYLEKAVKLDSNFTLAYRNLGEYAYRSQMYAKAIQSWQSALALSPDDPYLLRSLAWLLSTAPQSALRNGSQALDFARQLMKLTGGSHPLVLDLMATARAETGDFKGALMAAEKALALARATGDQRLADKITNRIQKFRSGIPIRLSARE